MIPRIEDIIFINVKSIELSYKEEVLEMSNASTQELSIKYYSCVVSTKGKLERSQGDTLHVRNLLLLTAFILMKVFSFCRQKEE